MKDWNGLMENSVEADMLEQPWGRYPKNDQNMFF